MASFNTSIGLETSFNGTVNLEAPILIDGKFEGEIISTSDIVVGDKGFLKGRVTCNNFTVYGEAEGEVICSDTMTVVPEGKYTGDIAAKNVSMEPGSVFDGTIKMRK